MAVAPTGAIYKALSFDNVSSRTYGVYITGQAVYNAPTRDVEMISIPGRNGAFALDKGRFENIEVSYPAGIFADNETDFAEAISDFRNFLCSRNGYVRLTDEYNPNEYRMAIYKSGLEVTPAQLKAGEFNIVFDCKPQRWLMSGETAVTIGEWSETETASSDIVSVENPNGVLAVKSLEVDLEPIQSGSGTPSPTNIRPISGYTDVVVSRSGKNLCDTSLVYNGYINSSQQKIASNANARTLYLPCKPNTAYTVSKQAGQRFIVAETTEIPTNNVVVSNIVLDYTASSLTITTTASAKYIVAFVYLSTADTGITADQMLATCQIELGSEATAYEPYQGTTYTTALGRTVYGGTLDVTTGVLTVTHKLITCDGSEQWGMVSSGYFTIAKSNLDASLSTTEAYSDTMVCNGLPWMSTQPNTTASFNNVTHTVRVSMPSITSLSAFKTHLSNNNLQFLLKLATPQTYQLTAQQIELLTGDNNIWSSGETITLEYGQNPSVLFNPTLFESSPMLEVEGYGNINLNGAEIELSNEVMGDVVFWNSYNRELITNRLSWSLVGQNGILNNGDTITINGFEYSGYQTVQSTPPIDIALVSSSHSGITGVNIDFWYEYTSSERKGARVGYTATFPTLNFTYGTPSTLTDTEEVNYTLTSGEAVFPSTIHYQTTLAYDGDRTIAVSIVRESSATGFYYMRASMPQAIGASTVSILGHPTYIDTDMGNAYKIESNDYISLNRYIDLGSDLPVLGAGSNEITYDNTITDLKVIPRWWKV